MYSEAHPILVVDHEPVRRERIAQILAEEGFPITTAADGLGALRLAGQRRFALIVAAAGLPGSLDGPATLRQARARQPWLKALFTGDAGGRPRWDNPDCDDFVAAPLRRRELLGCVFELLHRQSAPGGAGLERRYRAQLRAS
jgi:CheY-like chemotaxis protein